MAEMTTVVEGKVKYRDGKKWKPRWCVLKKPSPVADRLLVHLYKDVKDALRGGSAKSNFPLDNFYGLEAGLCYDKETSVLAIICQKQVVLFAFESREILIQFEIKIRRSLGEEHQFPVRVLKVPPQSKLPLDLVRMHIHGQKFCLTNGIPPKVLVSWNITELRRFGTVDGKFCFEGGSRCGKGAGVHVFMTDQAEDVEDIVRLASVGRTPTMRRHTSKRRSEYLEPAKNSVSDNFKNFQNTQTYSVQNIQEDQTWMRPKRHSISFMDYRRGKNYMEKNRLISIENVEKERLMAIYDIPPRRIRKVESIQPEKQNREDMKTVQMNGRVQDVEHGAWCSGEYNNNVMSYQIPAPMAEPYPKGSKHTEEDSVYGSHTSIQSRDNSLHSRNNETNLKTVPMSSSAPALCGYGNVFMDQYNDYSQSMPNEIDEEIDQVAGLSHRRKALEKLQQEEIDLQREMSLLDEILQVCKIEENRHERSCQQKPPPLPLKGFKAGRKSEPPKGISFGDNISSSHRSGGKPFSSGYSDSALLSPNLLNKLKKIPSGSKLLAPLPYVNLEKFDIGDVGADHVHMPASISAQCRGGNWSVRDKKSQGYDNVKNEDVISNKENSHLSVSIPVSRENLRLSGRSGSESRLAPKKSGQSVEDEPIYMNEKRRKSDTPPPELPPKGQYLLSRSRQKLNFTAHSRPPPPMPLDRKQLQCPSGGQDNNCLQYQSPRQGVNPIPSPSASEDSYFIMTSFAKEPVTCMTPSTESSCDMVACRPVVKLLGWGSRSSSAIKLRSATSSESEGYMDMSGIINTGNQSSTFFSTAGAESLCSDSFSTTSDSLSSLNPTQTSSSCSSSSRPKYFRSFSASGGADTNISLSPELRRARRPDSISISAGNSPRDMRREMVRDTNYMLMSGVLSPHRTVLDSQRSLQSYIQQTPGGGQDLLDKSQQFFPAAGEENNGLYLRVQKEIQSGLDGNGLRKNDKRDSISKDITQEESCDSGADGKPDVPFPNLIDFQQHAQCVLFKSEPGGDISRPVPEIPTNSQQNVQALCSKPALNTANEKTALESPAKTPGFFTRLIRRNSKDRKIMSQSQENLLSTSSSETGLDKNITVKDGMSFTLVLSSSSSSASSRSQSHQELCLSSIKDRQRSSSFPNRSSFLAMTSDKSDHSSTSTGISDLSNQSDLGATSSSLAGSESLSTFTSSSDGKGASGSQENVLSQKDCDSMENIVDSEGNYDSRSYFYIGPLQGSDQVKYGNETNSGHKVDEFFSVEDEKAKLVPEKSDTKVFTVLRVEDIPPKIPDCSKTDDEKLIELLRTGKVKEGKFDKESLSELKSKLTLPLEEMLSPDQKAAAIARHISSLPPFVPPKMKSYPLCLSPVPESSPRKSLCEPEAESEEGGGTSGGLSEGFPTGSLAPALRKQQARATLRITPPSEDENGKIWIPRSSLPSQSSTNTVESSSVNSNNTSLVVDLSDLVEDTDDLSICSVDSSTHSEDAVRSSPASTILRPRFGKEYQKVERRRTTTDESSGTSPAITPHSPGAASVFTFEMPVAASEISTSTKDGEIQSPKFAKVTQLEQAFLSRSERGTELIQSPRALYMNVDLSPPASPLPSTCSSLPAEQFEPQLNYAEIDLSDAGQTDSSRKRSPVSKTPPSNIEYAMIDMVATAAAQKARKEHAQSREDSLRRDRKYSTSSLGAKERFGSLSLPSRKAATFAGQSSSSMDSTNF